MEWLFILGLAVWIWRQSTRIGALERQLAALKTESTGPRPAAPAPAPEPIAPAAPAEEELPPLVLDTPLPPRYFAETQPPADEREPLLLDTPLPEASNDDASPALARSSDAESIIVVPMTPSRASAPQSSRGFAQWLSESGLAWLGGGALALGIIWFLSFAATQNWFTPTVQLTSALASGVVLLGISEIVRRGERRNPLVAAMLAASAALTFCATSWAAYGGYHFIDWPMAAGLLTLCALILVGLSLLHGEALGVLAIFGALLTPALTDGSAWPDTSIAIYVTLVAAGGFALAWVRRWSWSAAVTLAGLYFWFAGAIAADDLPRAMALLSVASLGAVTLAMRPAETDEPKRTLSWRQVTTLGPTLAICVSSVLLLWVWASVALWRSGAIAGPALVGVFQVALASFAVRRRSVAPAAFAVAVASLVAGVVLYLTTRASLAPLGADVYPSLLVASVTVTLAALATRASRRARVLIAGAGAAGAALLTLLAATSREHWHSIEAWAPLFIGAALLFAAATRSARTSNNPQADGGVDLWVGGSAVLLLVGVESACAADLRTIGDAAAALLFAAAFTWRGWRGPRLAALAAVTLATAHALSPDLIDSTLRGAIPLWRALLTLAVGAALLLAASFATGRRAPKSASAEALSSASLVITLIATFLSLRWLAAGASAPLTLLDEHSLRAVTLLVAGYLLLRRTPSEETGFIARWRGHALMAAGLLYALIEAGLLANPWWGEKPAAITGPMLLDTLAIAFAAPAALAFATANSLYQHQRNTARAYAASGGFFALMWAALELRRAFHPATIATSTVGVFEGACYALMFIVFALLAAVVSRWREGENRPFAADLQSSTRVLTWVCLLIAAWLMLIARHPWWGEAAPSDATSRFFAVMAQAWAATLSVGLGRALSRSRGINPTRFAAACAAALFTWSFGHAAIHLAPTAGLGAYAHALWPLVLVISAAAITARVPGRDTVRAYLDDLEAIWATAIWPALGFAVLGLWASFNPWWGIAPVQSASAPLSLLGLAAYPLAALLSLQAANVPGVRWRSALQNIGVFMCVAHIFIAMTLLTRFLYQGAAMAKIGAGPLEMWTYSALWAVYGGALVAAGTFRRMPVLVWSGLALLAITAIKVFVFDTAQLSGLIRAGSAVGLGIVALSVAWAAQRINRAQPGDLVKVLPPRRDLRTVRRRRR